MSILDIRSPQKEEVTQIKFTDTSMSDNGEYLANLIENSTSDGMFRLVDCDGDGTSYISFKDLDNFIAALHKAKELWDTGSEVW